MERVFGAQRSEGLKGLPQMQWQAVSNITKRLK